jgi:putative phosphoribosyl transferase
MNRTSTCNAQECLVSVPAGSVCLTGNLRVPDKARGVVLFANGSSNRHSSRNRYMTQVLCQAGLATLWIDLLTPQEEAIDRQLRQLHFDIGLLAERVASVSHWLTQNPMTYNLGIGFLGTSTRSAAAVMAAAQYPEAIRAIVSSGGYPHFAGSALSRVKAPTLLIVGENDIPVQEMNQEALKHLHTEKQLEIIPGATHLFEELGALEKVTQLASEWFEQHLTPAHQPILP